MKNELDTLLKNHTWDITALPAGVRPIFCKWVYRVRKNSDGLFNKFKPRLVAKGFLQKFMGLTTMTPLLMWQRLSLLECLLPMLLTKGGTFIKWTLTMPFYMSI